jgi:hypothetical protein
MLLRASVRSGARRYRNLRAGTVTCARRAVVPRAAHAGASVIGARGAQLFHARRTQAHRLSGARGAQLFHARRTHAHQLLVRAARS